MKLKGVAAVFFSPTGNAAKITKTIAGTIAQRDNVPMRTFDFTLPQAREKGVQFSAGELVVFGIPVYAGRIPNKILPAVQTLFRGNGALAVPVVTFGNRSFDNALIEMRIELEKNGFHTIAGAAFVSEHVRRLSGYKPVCACRGGQNRLDPGGFLRRDGGNTSPDRSERRRSCPRLLQASAGGRVSGQFSQGQAENLGRMYRLRPLCAGMSHGVDQLRGFPHGDRCLYQVPGLREGLSGRRQIF